MSDYNERSCSKCGSLLHHEDDCPGKPSESAAMPGSALARVVIDDTALDTLTVKFWRDQPGANYTGNKPPGWGCHIGPNIIEGSGGFGETPLLALRNLCESIAQDEGARTDNRKLFLR